MAFPPERGASVSKMAEIGGSMIRQTHVPGKQGRWRELAVRGGTFSAAKHRFKGHERWGRRRFAPPLTGSAPRKNRASSDQGRIMIIFSEAVVIMIQQRRIIDRWPETEPTVTLVLRPIR